jgi:hypothetical protein
MTPASTKKVNYRKKTHDKNQNRKQNHQKKTTGRITKKIPEKNNT